MGRPKTIGLRVDHSMAAAIEERSKFLGLTVSDYIRSLVERDLVHGGQADALAKATAEAAITTGLLLNRFIAETLGAEKTAELERVFSGKATKLVESIIESELR